MNEKQFNFWQKSLTYANVITCIVGLLVAFFGNSIFFEIHNDYSKEVFFNSNEMTPEILQFKNFLFGIIGGSIVGFHILMILISENSFKKKEKWAYYAMWLGLLSWFCIDSSLSIYWGALYNVLLINIPALIVIGLPLVMTRKAFEK